MPRLLASPDGIRLTGVTILSGPNARNSGSNTAQDGTEQTFTSIGDLWAFQLDLGPSMGRPARFERGLMTALQSGANAMRFQYVDGDKLSPEDAGIIGEFGSQKWGNGEPWAGRVRWDASYPNVPVAASSAENTSIVTLADEFWGHRLALGDYIGFFPFPFRHVHDH